MKVLVFLSILMGLSFAKADVRVICKPSVFSQSRLSAHDYINQEIEALEKDGYKVEITHMHTSPNDSNNALAVCVSVKTTPSK